MNQAELEQFIDDFFSVYPDLKISAEIIPFLKEQVKVMQVKSKEPIVSPGKVCQHMYYVVHGGFVCRYIDEQSGNGKSINFHLGDVHPIMTCMDSYFVQVPTRCELRAIADSTILVLGKHQIDGLNRRDPDFFRFYHDVIIKDIVEWNDLKSKLSAYTAKEKYTYILEEMPSVIQIVPSKYIAEFCGISPEWLSKLKKQS